MEVQERNGIKIYSLNTGASLPPWLGERARRNLSKRDSNIRHRVELLQDFDMPSSSIKIRQSADGRYLLAAGSYHPRVRCYDVDQLGMKFERYIDAEPVDIHFLGWDYGKFAILGNDRSVSFHAPYGQHAVLRIPAFGRALGYEPHSCDLLIPSSAGEVYRFNLEEGRFQQPFSGTAGGNCIVVSPTHALSAVGCEDGIVRFYDNRASNEKPFVSLDIASATDGMGFFTPDEYSGIPGEICSVAFDSAGLHFACGTKAGCVPLYDMRSSKPLHVKEHQNGLPIHTVQFHKGANCVISSDAKLIKIWRAGGTDASAIVANIESQVDLTHVMVAGDESDPSGANSGLLLCASEDPRMQAFYCPALGAAPRWCSFLENITEELEEENLLPDNAAVPGAPMVESVYDDYKFVTLEEVEQLGIANLIGTKLLRGYMHGFFMDLGLYSKIRAVANPFEYEQYRKKKIKEKMEEKQASRIAPKKRKKTVINAEFATRLEAKAEKGDKAGKTAKSTLSDDRFASLFENPDFEIDEENEAFKLRNASGVSNKGIGERNDDMDSDQDDDANDDQEEHVQDNSDGQSDDDSDVADDSESDDDGFAGAKVRGEGYEATKQRKKSTTEKSNGKKKGSVAFEALEYESDDGKAMNVALGDAKAHADVKRMKNDSALSLQERLAMRSSQAQDTPAVVRGQGASRSVTFIPKSSKGKRESKSSARRSSERRSAKDLRK